MNHLWRIIKFARELWPVFIAISLLTVLSAALGQVAPLLIRQIVDGIAESLPGTADLQPLLWLVAGIFLASLASILVGNLGGYLGDMMAIRLERILTASYSTHLTKLPQTYFDNQQTGSIVSRLTRAVTTIKSFLNVFANNFLSTFANLIFGLAVVAYFYWPAALIMITIYPIYYFFTERSSRHWQKIQKKINDIIDGAYGRLNQVIGQLKVVRAFGRENSETKLLDKQLSKVVGLTRRQSRHWHRQDIYRRILADSLSFLVLAIVVGQAAAGRFSLGTLVLFITYILQLRFPLFAMSFLVDNAQRAIAGSREFFEVLAVEPAAADPPGAKNLKIAGGAIRFEGVDFGYDKNRTVLTDISFDLPAGGKLALVGESGQGKTTIVNLLLGLYKPEAGRILIDGQDIATVKQRSLRSAIGTVFQDASLFAGTVRQNILYGRPSASEEAMIKAAKAANAHDFIQKLPKGYDTAIGERGIRLSGGQQQRVAIARAILDDPPILLLDEATSSLDSKAEAQVQEALDRLMKNRTTIIIAHRLSTIASVDFIVTLSGGRVDEIGPPNKLAQTGGIYGQLLDLQNANPQKRRRILKKYDLAN